MNDATKGRRAVGKRKLASVDKYLDAAEALFIRLGYEGASIRAISARAGLSLATVVYHWGTKAELYRAVCVRRFEHIQKEQWARLQAIAAKGNAVGEGDIDAILRALVEPPLTMHRTVREGRTIRLLYGRILTDPSPTMARVTLELFSKDADLCRSLLRQCLPLLDDETFYRRYTCALGAFVFTQSFGYRISDLARLEALQSDWKLVADEIVQFMKVGLTAPIDGRASRQPVIP